MKAGLLIGLGVCAAATAVAFADPPETRTETRTESRVIVRHGGDRMERMMRIDADSDGWVTRAEAAAEADRRFDDLDENNDGKLDAADHRARREERMERRAERRARHAERAEGQAETRREVRRVVVTRAEDSDEDVTIEHAGAPRAPRPPRPPMFAMMLANSEEFDADRDGALSREEFRTQQLRFFDAGDGNGDGRIRFEPPPEPPEAPEPPAPPELP